MFRPLKNALILSLVGHIVCAGLFTPTFGRYLDRLNFSNVSFLGAILNVKDLQVNLPSTILSDNRINLTDLSVLPINIEDSQRPFVSMSSLRPNLNLAFEKTDKITFSPKIDAHIVASNTKDPQVMFYPRLPHSFLIYFKDRQKVHIEYKFLISQKEKIAFIDRKISSGNLEVDLMASRYIARHLNLVKSKLPVNSWQTVKIDLTRKNDQN